MYKSSSKTSISPNTKKFDIQKLKENNNNNINPISDINNLKCVNVNIMESEDKEKKSSMESLGDKEYVLCLKNALKEALDENERVRKFF